jgi:hypothetical protein
MVAIPIDTRLKTEQLIEDREIESDLRPYLGLSSIADKCRRKLWYGFRLCGTEKINARKERLFSRGHKEEPIILKDLESIGVVVLSTQETYICGNGHIKGHSDGKLGNIPDAPKTDHLGEFKTANDKNFKKLQKVGLKEFNPNYWGQIHTYMHLGKLTRCLYIVANKNDDSRLYYRFNVDPQLAKELIQKGIDIISTEVPPERMPGASRTWFECKWCKFYYICFYDDPVKKTCRSCTSCDICDDGKWECSKYGMELSFGQQLLACKRYELMEGLK